MSKNISFVLFLSLLSVGCSSSRKSLSQPLKGGTIEIAIGEFSGKENQPSINGVQIQPINSSDIQCYQYDKVTEFCIKPRKGIYDLYSTESIKVNRCRIPTFSQDRKIAYEQMALNYFVDSIWAKNVAENNDRVYVIPQVNSASTYLRAPYKFSSDKRIRDSTEIEVQKQRLKYVNDLDLTKDSLTVDHHKVSFQYISPAKRLI